jgi:hypothetical protein
MAEFQRAEHRAVAKALRAMDHDLLARNNCWFGMAEDRLDTAIASLTTELQARNPPLDPSPGQV